MNRALLIGITCILVGIAACTKNKVDDYKKVIPPPPPPMGLCDSLAPTYTNTIERIISQNCTNTCHKPGFTGDFLLLTNYAEVRDAFVNKHLLEAVRHETPYSPMPKGGNKLADSLIQRLECWKERKCPQ